MNDNIESLNSKYNFIYGELDNNFIYFEIVSEKGKSNLFINGIEFKSESYINEFLINILDSYPNIDEEYNKYFFNKYFNIDNNFSRKKNYFVNKLDREIQQHLRLNPVPISKFSQTDRLFFTNNKFPELNKNVFQKKFSQDYYIELIYILKNIYNLDNIREVKNIYYKYTKNKSNNINFQIITYLEIFYFLKNYGDKLDEFIVSKILLFINIIENLIINYLKEIKIDTLLLNNIIINDFKLILNFFSTISIVNNIDNLNKSVNNITSEINLLINFLESEIIVLDTDSILTRLNLIKSFLNNLETILEKLHLNIDNNKFIDDSSIKFTEKFPLNKQPEWGKIFITPHEIMEIESNATSLWIITPDFYFELQTYFDYFENLIMNNLTQGKTFKYFYPPESRPFAKQVQNKYKKINTKGNVIFNEVKELSNFFMLFNYEIILYDPDNINSKYHSGFFTDFFKEKETHSTTKPVSIVHTRLSNDKMNQIIKILSKY